MIRRLLRRPRPAPPEPQTTSHDPYLARLQAVLERLRTLR